MPEQTQNGIEAKILLNPQIEIGQLVKLDSSAVNLLRYGADLPSQRDNIVLSKSVKTNADGLYYCMYVTHEGDTRGEGWHSKLVLLAVDATLVPANSVGNSTVLPADAIARF